MAKIYGGRWKNIGTLGAGGQSDVFRVIDTSNVLQGEYALKRVRNPDRHARFRDEVEAVMRLRHQNIVPLTDHSALDEPVTNDGAKQFLVMPIASAGDLSQRSRLSLYPESLDAILIVVEQLTAALDAAHAAHIVHRDVKPQNILFTGDGHKLWLSDFGICLIRGVDRSTDTGEVVGPRAFMAPELEEGGQLDVSYAADVYSLGKVIFYMLSGGVVLSRERLDETQWDQMFAASERHKLLRQLLRRMVCPLKDRISTMAEISKEIVKLKVWEQTARELPVTSATLAGLDRLRDQNDQKMRTLTANADARARENQNLASVCEVVLSWLDRALSSIAAMSTPSMELIAETVALGEIEYPSMSAGQNGSISVLAARQIVFRIESDLSGRDHLLRFLLGVHKRIRFQFGNQVAAQPMVDQTLSLIPYYIQRQRDQPHLQPVLRGFLTGSDWIKPRPGVGPGRQVTRAAQSRVTSSYLPPITVQKDFKVSEFPSVEPDLRACLDESMQLFIAYIESGANIVG